MRHYENIRTSEHQNIRTSEHQNIDDVSPSPLEVPPTERPRGWPPHPGRPLGDETGGERLEAGLLGSSRSDLYGSFRGATWDRGPGTGDVRAVRKRRSRGETGNWTIHEYRRRPTLYCTVLCCREFHPSFQTIQMNTYVPVRAYSVLEWEVKVDLVIWNKGKAHIQFQIQKTC